MKHLLLCLFLFLNSNIFAQNAVAELQFEQAETAFNDGDFDLTIQKVDAFEASLGNITDKSLYLRVVSQSKLFRPEYFFSDSKQFALYNALLANSSKYIKATQNNGLSDKFKEVYAIYEKLNKLNLPNEQLQYDQAIQKQKEIADKDAKQKQAIAGICNKTFEQLSIDDLPFGISIEEFQKRYPAVLGTKPGKIKNKHSISYFPQNIYWSQHYGYMLEKFEKTDPNILVFLSPTNSNKICGYLKMIYFYKGKEDKQFEFEEIKKELIAKYKPLEDCAESHYLIGGEFYARNGNKNILIQSNDKGIYQLSVLVGKAL